MPDSPPYRLTTPTILFISLLVGMAACGILNSDDPPELEPGPRNYEWSVDTLYSPPGGFIFDIWGSSPNDVWAVANTGVNNLWHFNGEEWSTWPKRVGTTFYSIYGFSQDDIWMGGNDGKLYHFDGNEWALSFRYDVEGMRGANMRSIWGNSPDDIYVAGNIQPESGPPWESFLLHFDGNRWNELVLTNYGMLFQRVRSTESGAFLEAYDRDHSPSLFQFYRYESNRLEKLFSVPTSEIDWFSLNKVGNEMFYVLGDALYTYSYNRFIKEVISTPPNFGFQIYGRHKKDMFLRMSDGLAHYNGVNAEYLFNLDHSRLSISNNAVIFENKIFFIVRDYDQGSNYIYHGSLTEQEEEP